MTYEELFHGVFKINFDSKGLLATKNLTPGLSIYGEKLIRIDNEEFRIWNPFRSKLSAAILKGLKKLPIYLCDKVLYLGVASGTTCSHISDIVGRGGHIWGVEFSPTPLIDLIEKVAKPRGNVSPVLADARNPKNYAIQLPIIDVIYADIAQPQQATIVVQNSELLLKPDGWVILAIKARSIDQAKDPSLVYKKEIRVLEKSGFCVVDFLELEPYEKDHALVVAKRAKQ
jgi:fibrillarin-like pre-rRNA processing protein